jgi:hypothetical protein
MCCNLNRRQWLGAVGGMGAALLTPVIASARTNPYYRPLRYYFHNNFNKTELAILGPAVNFVAQRLLDPRMFAYARTRYQQSYTKIPNRRFRTAADFQAWFTKIQLPALLDRGFPTLQIRGQFDANSNWTGRASVGTVTTEYVSRNGSRPTAYVAGAFDVTLNTAMLGSNKFHLGNCENYWAGVIAHEMLHNMGHEHPVGVYEGTFIRAYERAVWLDADPRRQDKCEVGRGCCG